MPNTESRKLFLDWLDAATKIVIAVIAGLWVLHTYPDSKEKEFRKAYWDKQMSMVFEASEVTAKIATLRPDTPERAQAVDRFWMLYWGPMTVVESKCERCDAVDQAMQAFGKCLPDPAVGKAKDECTPAEMEQRSINLGKAARETIGESWDQKLKSLTQGCAQETGCPASK